MRNVFVESEFEPLRIDQDELNFIRTCAIKNRNDQRINANRLTGAGRSGDQQVRHLRQVGDVVKSVDCFAERDREFRSRLAKCARLDNFPQEDCFAPRIWHLDADVRFTRHAIDANRLGFQRQTQIVNQRNNARVFHARIGFELVGGDHRTGTDVFDLTGDIKLFALFSQPCGQTQQFSVGLFAVRWRFVQKLQRWHGVVGVGDATGAIGVERKFAGGGRFSLWYAAQTRP